MDGKSWIEEDGWKKIDGDIRMEENGWKKMDGGGK